MALTAEIEVIDGKLPAVAWRWDAETEILSGQFKTSHKSSNPDSGLTGSVELEGSDGSFVMLDVAQGVLRGLEVVVWPEGTVDEALVAPGASTRGRALIPGRPSQPGVAAVEVDTVLTATKRPDESVIYLRVGPKRRVEVIQLADGLLLEIDANSSIAGLWLLNVPPFPQPDA
jgi:hypothetical protein